MRGSSLFLKFHDSPQWLQRTLDQIRHLLHLADLTANKATEPSAAPLPLTSQPSSDGKLSSQISSAITPTLPLSWLEVVWKSCTTQAQALDEILQPMLQEAEDTSGRRTWKRILTLKRQEKIEQALGEIERCKTMLSVWFGQECLHGIRSLQHDVSCIHGDIGNFGKDIIQINNTLQNLVAQGSLGHLNHQAEDMRRLGLHSEALGPLR